MLSFCVYCLCCPVLVAALWRADPPSRESYRLSIRVIISELILNRNRPESLICQHRRRRRSVQFVYSKEIMWWCGGFEVLTAVTVKTSLWVITQCRSRKVWLFRGAYFLHLQGWRVSQARNHRNRQPAELVPLKRCTVPNYTLSQPRRLECSIKLKVWCVYSNQPPTLLHGV
jgi:hypothetical protein